MLFEALHSRQGRSAQPLGAGIDTLSSLLGLKDWAFPKAARLSQDWAVSGPP